MPGLKQPIPNSYVLPGTRLVAGEYPREKPPIAPPEAEEKLVALLGAGVTAFVDLTESTEGLTPYEPMLREIASRLRATVSYERLPIRDMDVCDPEQMQRVLDTIDVHLGEGRAVYLHCMGGVGRTGMVVGCWLARHGAGGTDALQQVADLFRSMSPDKVRRHAGWGSPQTDAQRAMVRDWKEPDRVPRAEPGTGDRNAPRAQAGDGAPYTEPRSGSTPAAISPA